MRHTGMEVAVGVLAVVAVGGAARSEPSFACRGDLSQVEVVICTTESLALLDQQLTAAYKRRYDTLTGAVRHAFAMQQKEWVRKRDDCHLDKVCLREAYSARIRRIEAEERSADEAASPAFADVTRFDRPRLAEVDVDVRPTRRSAADAVNVAHRFCALKGFRTMVEYRLDNAPTTVAIADNTRFRNPADSKTAYRYIACGNPR